MGTAHATFVRFNSLRKKLGSRVREETIRAMFERLIRAYGEEGRYYHTLAHIDHCLQVFDAVRDQCTHPNEVELAIWYHDSFYDFFHGVDNESKSAIIGLREATVLRLASEQQERIGCCIFATDHLRNVKRKLSNDEKLVADIDLYALSLSHDRVVADRMNIRREYAHVDDGAFAGGSLEFFVALTSRGFIYHTPYFKQFEENARRNIDYILHNARSIVPARTGRIST